MSAIIYIGPVEAEEFNDCGGVDGDTLTEQRDRDGRQAPVMPASMRHSTPDSRFDSGPQSPLLTQRIRHDYAYLADRPMDVFNGTQPVTRCDRCLKVAMTTIVVTITVLLYVLSYLQKVGAS